MTSPGVTMIQVLCVKIAGLESGGRWLRSLGCLLNRCSGWLCVLVHVSKCWQPLDVCSKSSCMSRYRASGTLWRVWCRAAVWHVLISSGNSGVVTIASSYEVGLDRRTPIATTFNVHRHAVCGKYTVRRGDW